MRPSFRALFLILVASLVLHFSVLNTLAILIGYLVLERLDWWMGKRAREKKFDEIIFEWKQSKEDPEEEVKGTLSRIRLTGQNQIITARVADLLRKMF